MNRIYEVAKKQNGYLLITYVFLLALIIKYSETISGGFNKIIGAFTALFVGAGIAYVLNIPMSSIEGFLGKKLKKRKRALAMILTYILAIVIIAVLLSLIIPQLIATIISLVERGDMFVKAYEDAAGFIKQWLKIDLPLDMSGLLTTVLSQLNGQMQMIAENMMTSASAVANGSMTFFVSIVVSIYLLASKETVTRQIRKLIGALLGLEWGNKSLVFLGKVNHIFTSYVSGLLLDAVIIGSLIALMMMILGLPYVVLVGVITTVLAIIPIFGNIMAMIFGAILIFAVNPLQAVYFIIGYQVVQQLENNLIYPRIVGSSVGLPGLWTLLAVSVGGSLFGFSGMLVAVPVTSTIYMMLSDFANWQMNTRAVAIDDEGMLMSVAEGSDFIGDME